MSRSNFLVSNESMKMKMQSAKLLSVLVMAATVACGPVEESISENSTDTSTDTVQVEEGRICAKSYFVTDGEDPSEYVEYHTDLIDSIAERPDFEVVGFDDIRDCQHILGTLFVGYNMVNLDDEEPLMLETIGDDLWVLNNLQLTDLSFLSSLREVNRDIKIGRCDGLSCGGSQSLETLDGLEALMRVGGNITIGGNPLLENFSAMANVRELGGLIEIKKNDSLLNLDGLAGIEGHVGAVWIQSNLSLVSSVGLSGVESTDGYFTFQHHPELSEFTGLSGLKHVGGACRLGVSPLVTDLSPLASLEYVGDMLTMGKVGAEELRFDSLTTVGGTLGVVNNPALNSIQGLRNLEIVGNHLDIYGNDALVDLEGLNSVRTIGGVLQIWNNDNVTHIDALHMVEEVAGGLLVEGNPMLDPCAVRDLLDAIGTDNIGGELNTTPSPEDCNE